MKEDLLGLNHWLSFSASGMPKCFRYHAARAALSPLVLKKTPPTPVIFAIAALLFIKPPNGSRLGGGRSPGGRKAVEGHTRRLAGEAHAWRRPRTRQRSAPR